MRLTGLLSALFLVLGVATAWAEDLPITAFHGAWQGTGVAANADSLYFSVTPSDLGPPVTPPVTVIFDVEIAPADDGFAVTWTWVIPNDGDPNNPERVRLDGSLNFEPSERAGVFEATNSGNPLEADVLSWARIDENTLTMHQMVVFDSGGFELVTYDWTLTSIGLEQTFTRLRDGEPIRSGTVRLVKIAG
jgi:hypothetical protein